MTEFVEDWSILHTLGEGAFGEVKLLVHRTTEDTVAVKIIDLEKHKNASDSVKKEVFIHRLLVHPNIIRYFGQRKENLREYIFLEYASGGELFNKIEPDIGMPNWEAQKYFKQLLNGVEYLHTKGIAHRDLKPENLLLDHDSNVKITDFGMATLFRMRGKERLLDKRCGTLPYIPPEVLETPYHAEPADLWSCGIVLVAMLSGELPWDQPTSDQKEYESWKEGKYMLLSPWIKLDNMALSLARCILVPDPMQRFTLEKIIKHRWVQHAFHKTEDVVDGLEIIRPAKRLCSNDELSQTQKNPVEPLGLSQPIPQKEAPSTGQVIDMIQERVNISFSQPTHFDDLIVSSQFQFTQSPVTQNNFQRLVCRMTRFFVTTDCEKTLKILCSKLEQYSYTWNSSESGLLTISTVDNHFRLSKGCGLEFKRRFVKLKHSLKDIIYHDTTRT
ncbi:grapes [Carabus blaptoides fortunei]